MSRQDTTFTLYISDCCHDCGNVVAYINNNNVDCEIRNIDRPDEKPPMQIFIIPALARGKQLLAYGERDILQIFEGVKA